MSVAGPVGSGSSMSPWWAASRSSSGADRAAAAYAGRPAAAAASGIGSSADEALKQSLLNGLSAGAGNRLQQLTQIAYSADFKPDLLAVRTGPAVTTQFAGGHENVGINMFNASITFFAGKAPEAVKGVAITFGPEATSADRKVATELATSYLNGHLSDSQDRAGRWNQPTFDMFT